MSWIHYNLRIPTEAYKILVKIARQEEMTIPDLLRRATKLFLFVLLIKQDPSTRMLIEQRRKIQEIVVI